MQTPHAHTICEQEPLSVACGSLFTGTGRLSLVPLTGIFRQDSPDNQSDDLLITAISSGSGSPYLSDVLYSRHQALSSAPDTRQKE